MHRAPLPPTILPTSLRHPAKPAVKAPLLWSGLALALALSAPALRAQTAEAASAPAAAASLPALTPVAWPEDGLDIEKPDRLKGVKKVALAGVSVYVLTQSSAGASTNSSWQSNSAVVSASMKVLGLDTPRLQALADKVYDQAAAALAARGIEVIPHAQLEALPEYRAFQALGKPSPVELDAPAGKGVILGGRGLPVIHMGELTWLNRTVGGLFGAKVEDPYVGMTDNMSTAFGLGKLNVAMDALSKATGAPLAMVRVVLSPAQVKASGGDRSASTSVRNSLAMPPWTNRILIRSMEGDYGRVSLKKPLISQTAVGELVDVTSAGTTAANIAVTLFTHLAAMGGTGRGVTASSRDLELRTTPEWFDSVALSQTGVSLGGLAAGLAP